jgi:hypothetical protein
LVAKVVETFSHWRFLTLTVDDEAFHGQQRRIFEHLREVDAVCELMRSLGKRGLTGRWFCVLEFQMGHRKKTPGPPTEQIHFHLIVETLTPTGFLDSKLVQEIWGRFRPEWAGPIGLLPSGKPRPGVGFCDVPKRRKYAPGKSAVIAYVTGYLGAAGKGGVPEWWLDWLDEGHNSQMYSCSRDFWPLELKKKKRKGMPPIGGKGERRPVRERLAKCRDGFDVLRKTDVLRNGEVVMTNWKMLAASTSDLAHWHACRVLFPALHPDKESDRSGFYLTSEQVDRVCACRDIVVRRCREYQPGRPRSSCGGGPREEPPLPNPEWDAWLAELAARSG